MIGMWKGKGEKVVTVVSLKDKVMVSGVTEWNSVKSGNQPED